MCLLKDLGTSAASCPSQVVRSSPVAPSTTAAQTGCASLKPMASVAGGRGRTGTVAGPVGGEVVVAGTVVAAPPGGVVVGTVVGATGHPALLALPPGVEYVREGKGKNKSELQTAPLLPTDAVVDVVALDRAMFDAANAAKRRVHLCNGAPGTLDIEQSFCVALGGPFVPPWTAHFVFFCPCVLGPQICNLIFPHKDMEVPPWADHALIVTDKGVVGRRYMRPDKTPEERAKQQAFYARWNHGGAPLRTRHQRHRLGRIRRRQNRSATLRRRRQDLLLELRRAAGAPRPALLCPWLRPPRALLLEGPM